MNKKTGKLIIKKRHPIKTPVLSPVLFSVESRKGGVGKTTFAIELSRYLHQAGFSVLFIDLDFTGTNTADVISLSYFKDIVPIYRGNDQDPANLLEVFADVYLSGDDLPSFVRTSSEDVKANVLKLPLSGVALFGSNLFRKGGQSITSPSIILDDLHSYWMRDYIERLINSYFLAVSKEQKKVAVVIDNSPGFTGLAPVIHDMLTDYGPHMAKFITVSSLDRQDIIACAQSVQEIHKIILDKAITADFKNNPTTSEKPEINKRFLKKLISPRFSEEQSLLYHCLRWYDTANIDTDVPVELYQGIVFNKVPRKFRFRMKRKILRSEFPAFYKVGLDQSGRIRESQQVRMSRQLVLQYMDVDWESVLESIKISDKLRAEIKALLSGDFREDSGLRDFRDVLRQMPCIQKSVGGTK